MWNRKVVVRLLEVILCVACVTALRITDDESNRVAYKLRNRSREWSLLTNVTQGVIGAALATATCGGYLIVTAGLLVGAATGELRGRMTEGFLLILGIVLFVIVGGLALFSIDGIPEELIDNAVIFGTLCLVTAAVLLIDFLMSPVDPDARKQKKYLSPHQQPQPNIQGFLDREKNKSAPKSTTTTTITVNQDEPPLPPATRSAGPKNHTSSTIWRSPSPQMTEHRVLHGSNDSVADVTDAFVRSQRRFEESERQTQAYEPNRSLNNHSSRTTRIGNKATMTREQDFLEPTATRSQGARRSRNYYYKGEGVYNRAVDEVDGASDFLGDEPIFARVSKSAARATVPMREYDEDRGYDSYRYSDPSHYDINHHHPAHQTVPSRMRTISPGTSRRRRGEFSSARRPWPEYLPPDTPPDPMADKLEQCLESLRRAVPIRGPSSRIATSNWAAREPNSRSFNSKSAKIATDQDVTDTLSTQDVRYYQQLAKSRTSPSSPRDPGFVRHAASNWPGAPMGTPNASPEEQRLADAQPHQRR